MTIALGYRLVLARWLRTDPRVARPLQEAMTLAEGVERERP